MGEMQKFALSQFTLGPGIAAQEREIETLQQAETTFVTDYRDAFFTSFKFPTEIYPMLKNFVFKDGVPVFGTDTNSYMEVFHEIKTAFEKVTQEKTIGTLVEITKTIGEKLAKCRHINEFILLSDSFQSSRDEIELQIFFENYRPTLRLTNIVCIRCDTKSVREVPDNYSKDEAPRMLNVCMNCRFSWPSGSR